MFPKNGDLFEQKSFITGFLKGYLRDCCRGAGIWFFGMPGNDDLRIFDDDFALACSSRGGAFDLSSMGKVNLGDHDVIGFNLVVDYPFRLKDRCRMDDAKYVFGRQLGKGMLSKAPRGFVEIPDWPEHARGLPTIEDELAKLPEPGDPRKAIYVIHMPPAGLGLDECSCGDRVGSWAVRRFLARAQPAFSLHGHIHESPDVSGHWKQQLGRTTCIQPGQMGGTTYVVVDLDFGKAERFVE
jgi:hypothetical protein